MPQGQVGASEKISVTRADLNSMIDAILREWVMAPVDPFGFNALLLQLQRCPSTDTAPALRTAGAPSALLAVDPKKAIGMYHTTLRRLEMAETGACINICKVEIGFVVCRAVCKEKAMFGHPVTIGDTAVLALLDYSRKYGCNDFTINADYFHYKMRAIRGGLEFYNCTTKATRTQVFFRSIRGVALPVSYREFGETMVTTYVIPDGLMTIAEGSHVAINGEQQPASITCEDQIVRVATCGKVYKIANNAAVPEKC